MDGLGMKFEQFYHLCNVYHLASVVKSHVGTIHDIGAGWSGMAAIRAAGPEAGAGAIGAGVGAPPPGPEPDLRRILAN